MSEIKVNKLTPRTNCGTVQLGDSGDTITIPAGVSITNNGTASGFGATGAASWNTTVKTGDFTAVAGEGYFVNTTSGAVNVTLPAGTAGAVVAIKDYANTFDTNAVTLTRNGSDKIGGQAINATLSTEGIAVTLVFIDSTQGWLVTDDGLQSSVPQPTFITATGGTITTCGDYKIHTFTGPGTFCVSCGGNSNGSNTVDYLVIAGGGGGGGANGGGGGGGAGGYREGFNPGSYTASPLATTALPVTASPFPITVGGGGTGFPSNANGSNSIFSTIISAGGGKAGCQTTGSNGGSGGGGSGNGCNAGGSGNTPPVSPPQGKDGGTSAGNTGAGGGGAGFAGANALPQNPVGGAGGDGVTSSINGTPTARAGGGGGNAESFTGGPGGAGGGGKGGDGPTGNGVSGTANTGGGGGGVDSLPGAAAGGSGGSGIVIIRYKFQ